MRKMGSMRAKLVITTCHRSPQAFVPLSRDVNITHLIRPVYLITIQRSHEGARARISMCLNVGPLTPPSMPSTPMPKYLFDRHATPPPPRERKAPVVCAVHNHNAEQLTPTCCCKPSTSRQLWCTRKSVGHAETTRLMRACCVCGRRERMARHALPHNYAEVGEAHVHREEGRLDAVGAELRGEDEHWHGVEAEDQRGEHLLPKLNADRGARGQNAMSQQVVFLFRAQRGADHTTTPSARAPHAGHSPHRTPPAP